MYLNLLLFPSVGISLILSSSFSSGNGTVDNPYIISTGEELSYFKSLIEGNNSDVYNDKYYALGSDINLDNHEWIAIGNSLGQFKCYFDGRGFTIKNIKTFLSESHKHLQMQSDSSDWCNTVEDNFSSSFSKLKAVPY